MLTGYEKYVSISQLDPELLHSRCLDSTSEAHPQCWYDRGSEKADHHQDGPFPIDSQGEGRLVETKRHGYRTFARYGTTRIPGPESIKVL